MDSEWLSSRTSSQLEHEFLDTSELSHDKDERDGV